MDLEHLLKKHFGYELFKTGQKEVINSILNGRHTLAMLPTGTGKSLCYQLPGYILSGQILIISPLLSLMQDQVEQLKQFGEKRVVALNSFLTFEEKNRVLRVLGNYKYIYISPEMLQVPAIVRKLQQLTIALFVIDEAHCISQWGYDFRPDYLKLGEIRNKLGNPLTLALTATATKDVREEIVESLGLESVYRVESSIDRPNIAMYVENIESRSAKEKQTIDLVTKLEKPGIIYFSSKKSAEQMASLLTEKGICRANAYHGGLDSDTRILIQQQFIHGQLDVICATSAFGMGVNKENIRFVIHFHLPMRMESYLQEIGRAGRDGKPSIAIILYSTGDEQLPLQLAELELPTEQQIDWLFSRMVSENQQQKRKPIFDSEVKDLGGFSEVQWRIMEYFLEYFQPHQMASFGEVQQAIRSFVKERLFLKKQNIFQMINWISTNHCRRETTLQYFNEELQYKGTHCCDYCGIKLTDYYASSHLSPLPAVEESWEQYLAKLLIK